MNAGPESRAVWDSLEIDGPFHSIQTIRCTLGRSGLREKKENPSTMSNIFYLTDYLMRLYFNVEFE